MRELILQGGDGSTFDEENRSGKTDIEVGVVFQLCSVKFYDLQSSFMVENCISGSGWVILFFYQF